PLRLSGLPPRTQMTIICQALRASWETPAEELPVFPGGHGGFGKFIGEAYESLSRPCSREVIDRALEMVSALGKRTDPAAYVMVHGDAHNNNMLRVPGTDEYKFIDPDGMVFERSYDVGVLMREWPEEYAAASLAAGRDRCAFLSGLTGVPQEDIWDWGFLQMTATALILLQIGQDELGHTMLAIAEKWTEGL
ncbi:MAG: phosphotransferase, partial [Clostridia bacterium]|nr:phosphotransferase [Clostridia bacterium]